MSSRGLPSRPVSSMIGCKIEYAVPAMTWTAAATVRWVSLWTRTTWSVLSCELFPVITIAEDGKEEEEEEEELAPEPFVATEPLFVAVGGGAGPGL